MDKEKLNKAAEESAIILYRNLSDPDVSEDGRTVSMFMSMFDRGVDWLMQQPLSERLTDDEKEKVKAIYFRNVYSVVDVQSNFTEKSLIDALFGEDLFREK